MTTLKNDRFLRALLDFLAGFASLLAHTIFFRLRAADERQSECGHHHVLKHNYLPDV